MATEASLRDAENTPDSQAIALARATRSLGLNMPKTFARVVYVYIHVPEVVLRTCV